jgi:hypothetical protein
MLLGALLIAGLSADSDGPPTRPEGIQPGVVRDGTPSAAALEPSAKLLLEALDELVAKSPEIAAFCKKLNEEYKKDATLPPPSLRLRDAFPVVAALDVYGPFWEHGKFPATAQAIRNDAKTVSESIRAKWRCATQKSSERSKECGRVLSDCAVAGWGAEKGALYSEELDSIYNVIRLPPKRAVSPFANLPGALPVGERVAEISAASWTLIGALCAARAESGEEFQSWSFVTAPETPKWAVPYSSVWDLTSLRAECAPSQDERAGRAKFLAYPTSISGRFPVAIWADHARRKMEECRLYAERDCSSVYFVRGETAIAYATESCEIRRVTVEDVRADLKRFELGGTTRADRLEHESLIDAIEACEAVSKNVQWRFKEPGLSANCGKQDDKKQR